MATRSVSHKTAVGATWLIAFRMITRVLGIGSTLIMARILVPADFGLVAMATAFSAAIDALSQIGLSQALVRRAEDDQKLHDTAFTLQAGRAVVTGVAVALLAPAASAWFGEPRLTPILWILAGLSAVSGFRNIGVVAFGRDMRYDRQFVMLAVPRLLQVAITIPLALMLRSYWALIAGIVLSKLLDLVMTYLMHPYRPRASLAGWRELAGFSLWTWAASIASILWDRCDPFIIGPALGTAQLGIFLLAFEVATLPITEMIVPAVDVLFAGFSMAQKEGSRPIALALPVATALLLVVMPVMVALSCTAGYIVASVLGPNWAAAQKLIAVLAWVGLFSPYSFVCTTALVAAGHLRGNFVANCIASVVKVAALSLTVSLSHDLGTIALVATLVLAGEASGFIFCLMRAGDVGGRACLAPLLRILGAGGTTLGLAAMTGLAFTPVTLPPWQAFAIGAPLGLGCIAGFTGLVALAWLIAGRPQGPETRIAGLIGQVAGPVALRLRTRFA